MIAPLLTALLALASAPQGAGPEPAQAATTSAAQRPPPRAPKDPDDELLRDLELLQQLELLDHLELFDEGR